MTILTHTIDTFSFIDNLQTTVRQLKVFSAIIYHLNNKQLPRKLLEQLLIAWSIEEERTNPLYLKAKGKITNEGKKTAALGYYVQISTYLGITSRFNDIYMNTKISQTFLYFMSKSKSKTYSLSISEKIFYFYMLLEHDADGMLVCISQLYNSKEKKQSLLQKEFKDAMSLRLLSKMEIAPAPIKEKVATKYKAINFIWKKSKKYSEHIIAPRYEWLSNLEMVNISRDNKDTLYSLSDKGITFYESLPSFNHDKLKDISKTWFESNFFSLCAKLYPVNNIISFSSLDAARQNYVLGEALANAARAVKSSLSFRLPVRETFLFICMDLIINSNISIEFLDIQDKLKGNLIYQSRIYSLKLAGRSNEGYISIRLNK